MAEVSAEGQKSSFFKELWERRVPHIVGSYILGSWAIIQFIEWIVARYLLSHDVTELSLRFFLFMLPAVVIFAWFHGRPGPDDWTRFEKRAYAMNFTGAAIALVLMFSGKNLGAATTVVQVEDEDGNQIERTILKAENFKDCAALLFKNNSGLAELDHLQFGLPYAISYDLIQDRRMDVFQPWKLYSEMGTAENSYALPMRKQREIAEESRSDFFINGEFVRDGKDYVVTTRLHDTKTGRMVQERKFIGPDYMALVDEMSVQLRKDMDVPDYQLDGIKDLPVVEFLTSSDAAFRSFVESFVHGEINKDYKRAIFEGEQCLREDSDWGLAHFRMLQLDSYVGRTDRMQNHMAKTMERIDAFPELLQYQIKSVYYLLRNEAEKRLKLIQMWSELYPKDLDAKASLAMQYKMSEQYDKAIEVTKAAIAIRDNRGELQLDLADTYRLNGDYENALAAYEEFNEKFPESNAAHMKQARIYRDQGDYEKALLSLERISLKEPTNIDPPLMISSIDDRLGNIAKSEASIKELMQRNISPVERQSVLGRANAHYGRRGMINKRVEILETRLEEIKAISEPINLGFHSIELMVAYLEAGRKEDAFEMMQEYSSIYQGIFADAGAFISITYHLVNDDLEKAEVDMKRIDNYTKQFGNQLSLRKRCAARIAFLQEDHKEVIRLIEELNQLGGGGFGTGMIGQLELAQSYNQTGETKKALEIIAEELEMDPANAKTHVAKARILNSQGKSEEAKKALDQAFSLWSEADDNYTGLIEARAFEATLKAQN